MIITYYGDGVFRLQSGDTSILVDPDNARLKSDITIRTSIATDAKMPAHDEVCFPGEYEIKGIEIRGYGIPEESDSKNLLTVYSILWDDIRFVLLGVIGSAPSGDVLDALGTPDVLIIPIGSKYFSPETAAKFAKQVEPPVIIPSRCDKEKELSKEFGKIDKQEKLVFKKKDLDDLAGSLVLLESKNEK